MESMTFVHFLEFGLRARLLNIKLPETGVHFVKSDSFVRLSTHVTERWEKPQGGTHGLLQYVGVRARTSRETYHRHQSTSCTILGGERRKRRKRLAEEHKFGTDDNKDLPRLS